MSHHTLSWQTHSSFKLASIRYESAVPQHLKDVFRAHDYKTIYVKHNSYVLSHVKTKTGKNYISMFSHCVEAFHVDIELQLKAYHI